MSELMKTVYRVLSLKQVCALRAAILVAKYNWKEEDTMQFGLDTKTLLDQLYNTDY